MELRKTILRFVGLALILGIIQAVFLFFYFKPERMRYVHGRHYWHMHNPAGSATPDPAGSTLPGSPPR